MSSIPTDGACCKSSYIKAPKAREPLGFYPKSYSGFGSSRSCAPPLVDDSVLSPEELGSSPARVGQLSRSHGGKVDSRIGTRKRESPGRPYPREGEECKSSYIKAPKAREPLGFYPKSYTCVMQTPNKMMSRNACAPLGQVRHIVNKPLFCLQGVDLRFDHQLCVGWWSWLLLWYIATVYRLPLQMQTPLFSTHRRHLALSSIYL